MTFGIRFHHESAEIRNERIDRVGCLLPPISNLRVERVSRRQIIQFNGGAETCRQKDPDAIRTKYIRERGGFDEILGSQDQGIGIPRADQERLFGAFQRGSNVGPVRGTGLGLAIVKQSVEMHRGSVHLESQEGKGTTVRVMIPTHSQ